MTPTQRLLLEAGALVRGHESPFCRRAAALEAERLTAGDLMTRWQDLSHVNFAIRETIVAIGLAHSARRRYLIDALGLLVDAARVEPEATIRPTQVDGRRLYWLEK